MASNRSTGLFWLLVFGGCGVYFFNQNQAHPPSSGVVSSGSAHVIQASVVTPELPYAEQQFIDAVREGHRAYDAGGNDTQKGASRPCRAKAVCAAIPSGAANNWVGTIYKLSSNGDGKGILKA